ncbi:hypothetical protein FQA39_LY15064 [Lamprigera yunnana]|nr:hypothetical protein FQA39_LY15064 [Lamprigera yunnana]
MAAANQSSLKRKMLYLDENDGEGGVDFDSDNSVQDKIFEPSGSSSGSNESLEYTERKSECQEEPNNRKLSRGVIQTTETPGHQNGEIKM